MKTRMKKGRAGSGKQGSRGRRRLAGAGGSNPLALAECLIRTVEDGSRGMPGAGYAMTAIWPLVLLAIVSGMAFELAKWAVVEARRHIYNQNRNRKYTEAKHCRKRERKNMAWRTEKPRDWRKPPLPPPPMFVEDLCKQWDKVHDSPEEVVKFGEMVIELEDYVDNAFIFDMKGDIVGRHPGIKGFLAEKCPHIGYVTAISYRILALKAREATRRKENIVKTGEQCHTVRELRKRLDKALRVTYRHLENPRRRCCRPRKDHSLQCAIFAIREEVRSTGRLDATRRRRVIAALREIARELDAS